MKNFSFKEREGKESVETNFKQIKIIPQSAI